jgi:hypothetical protein
MTEDQIDAMKSLSLEQKEMMKANIREKATLRFEDFKGRWYAPCCADDAFQIDETNWLFAYNFNPAWAKFETYDSFEDLKEAMGSDAEQLKVTKEKME